MPVCPDWLPGEGARKWNELAPKLFDAGLLTELDGETLAVMCMHWAVMVEAIQDLRERGILVTGARGDGGLVKNPSLQVLKDNSAAFDRYAAGFGMDPRSRAYVDSQPENEDDEFLKKILRGGEN
jgi:P27 family predicted phage terminase small subunit